MRTRRTWAGPGCAAGVLCVAIFAACGGGGGDDGDGGSPCPEFPDSLGMLQGTVDGNTLAALQAGADLLLAAQTVENAAFGACVAIDKDLGVTDTWSAKGSLDDQVTEACAQAAAKIKAVLAAATTAQVSCQLSVSTGRCIVDGSLQATCEAACNGADTCTFLGVTLRCAPAQLTGECGAMCEVNSVCEGGPTPALEAPCSGSCEADCDGVCNPTAQSPTVHCEGKCTGNCTGACNGQPKVAAACAGKCSGSCDAPCDDTMGGGTKAHCDADCVGKCTGNCTITSMGGVTSGTIGCRGSCSVVFKTPQCEGKLAAPACMIDAPCEASCQSHAELQAKCTTPAAALECDGTPTADVTKLVATVAKNLPALVEAGRSQGVLTLDGATLTAGALSTLAQNKSGALSGKALACATVASAAAGPASTSVTTSVQASAAVTVAAGEPM
jgi:hypothetical protein